MWVFPGGKVDEEDRIKGATDDDSAKTAACRECLEESGLAIAEKGFNVLQPLAATIEAPKDFQHGSSSQKHQMELLL